MGNEIRCGACSKKLGEGAFTLLKIQCPRCKTLNVLRTASSPPERPERLSEEDAHGGNNRFAAG